MTKIYVDPDIEKAETLPAVFYRSNSYFDELKEKVFVKSWQFVGHEGPRRGMTCRRRVTDRLALTGQVLRNYPAEVVVVIVKYQHALARDGVGKDIVRGEDLRLLEGLCWNLQR